MSVFFPVASSIIYDLSLVEVHIELLVCGVIRQKYEGPCRCSDRFTARLLRLAAGRI